MIFDLTVELLTNARNIDPIPIGLANGPMIYAIKKGSVALNSKLTL